MTQVTHNRATGTYETAEERSASRTAENTLATAPSALRTVVGNGGYEATATPGSAHGTFEHRGSAAFNTAEVLDGPGLSAVSKSGLPVLGRSLVETDRVTFGGQTMTVAQAASLGFIKRQSEGNYVPFDEGQPQPDPNSGTEAAREGTDDVPEGETFRASDEAEEALTGILERTHAHDQHAALGEIVATGAVSPVTLERMASAAGVGLDDMRAQINEAQSGLYEAVTGRLAGLGVYSEDVFSDWINAESGRSQALNKAVHGLMASNDTGGFDELARKFTEGLDMTAPEAVTAALSASGIGHRQAGNGALVLTIPGVGEMAYAQAVREGFIRVSRS